MDDEREVEKDADEELELSDDVFDEEVDDDEEEAEAETTDEFGNPKEEEKSWE